MLRGIRAIRGQSNWMHGYEKRLALKCAGKVKVKVPSWAKAR